MIEVLKFYGDTGNVKRTLCIFLVLLLLAGCQKQEAKSPTLQAKPEATPEATAEATAEPLAEATAEPAPEGTAGAAYAFSFTARTLDGTRVTEAYFGQYDLTMVNVWASWCGPCRSELSELGALYTKLPENVGLLSITVDDPRDVGEAKALLEKNGCAFPCLDGQSSSGLFRNFLGRVTAIPTSLFFDRTGHEVGSWILGVPQGTGTVSETYLKHIQTRLDSLNLS